MHHIVPPPILPLSLTYFSPEAQPKQIQAMLGPVWSQTKTYLPRQKHARVWNIQEELTKLSSALCKKSEISFWSKFSTPGTIKVICCGLIDDDTPFWHQPGNELSSYNNRFTKEHLLPTTSNLCALVVSSKTWSETIQFFLPSGLWVTANNTFSESFLNSSSNPFSSARFTSLSCKSSPLLVSAILWLTIWYWKITKIIEVTRHHHLYQAQMRRRNRNFNHRAQELEKW